MGEPINEAVTGLPAPALRPFIGFYSGYRQVGVCPASHRGLPSPYLTVIFTLDDALVVAEHPDPRQPPAEYRTLVGGLHSVPALVTHEGRQSGIQLAMSPLGALTILGVPAGELASIDIDGADVLGALANQVQERLQAAPTWSERFDVLDEVLLGRLGRVHAVGQAGVNPGIGVSPEVGHAWGQLLATGGTIPIATLARQTGWSDRYLRTRFCAEIGLTPKTAARVVRFDRARRELQRRAVTGRALDLAGLAAGWGYYDQSHLDAEFRALAGSAPTAWLAQEFRNLQATSVAHG